LKVYFLIDRPRVIFRAVVCFISSIVVLYRKRYIEDDLGKVKFLFLVLLFVLSMIFIIIGTNRFMILLGWDGLGLVSYCLVIYYQNERSNRAGIITVLTNRIGDVGILLALVFIINFGDWSYFYFTIRDSLLMFIVLFLMLGAVTKRAQIPFSAWLPAAIAAPTPVSALVHSSTLVTAGVYLIIRIRTFFRNGELRKVLLYISVLTIFISGVRANFETDIKKIIALSTLSQLGVIIIVLSVGFFNLAFFHLITHAIFKAMLFLCAGAIIHGVGGTQDIRSIGIIRYQRPLIRIIIILARLSLAGFPFLRGFYSKDMILELIYVINSNFFIVCFIIVSTILTVIYSLRLIYYRLWRGLLGSSVSNYSETSEIVIPIILIGGVVIFMGRAISWFYFPIPVFISLSFNIKTLNLFIVIIGLVLFIFFKFKPF